jgi:hypothetical protein
MIGRVPSPSTVVVKVRLLFSSMARWKPTMSGRAHRIGRQRIHEPLP